MVCPSCFGGPQWARDRLCPAACPRRSRLPGRTRMSIRRIISSTSTTATMAFSPRTSWRLTPKVTLNYGLRWDFEGGLTQMINHDYRGFQPRVGLAYSPTKHTVIRSGFGIFDDHYTMTFLFVTYPQREVVIPNAPQPWVRKGNETAPWALNLLPFQPIVFGGLKYPDGSTPPLPADAAKTLVLTGQNPPNFNTGPAGTLVTNSGGGIDRNSRIPYSEQASLGIDQELGKGLVLSASYLFVASHKQVRPENLNVCPPGGLTN